MVIVSGAILSIWPKERQSRFGHVPDRDLSYFAEGSDSFADYVEGSWLGAGLRARESPRDDAFGD
ncbi:hypothetical protein PKHYL_33770 [Psychrobacter sp. KH172YL61]|nr:hypothetical protein PKHYL_33770 [Psychrobacter sp. KH172YL61]